MAVKPIPDGYHAVTPYLMVKGGARALDFYQQVFGATVLVRMDLPNGGVAHAEFKIGDSLVMLSDEQPGMDFPSPETIGGTPVGIHLYVPDSDATFARALAAGATQKKPIQDQFYGDRSGTIVDPFGHLWTISTHVEDVSPEEMTKRMDAMKKAAV
jgi:PhnB protein